MNVEDKNKIRRLWKGEHALGTVASTGPRATRTPYEYCVAGLAIYFEVAVVLTLTRIIKSVVKYNMPDNVHRGVMFQAGSVQSKRGHPTDVVTKESLGKILS